MVGEGPLKSDVIDYCKAKNLSKSVHFNDWCDFPFYIIIFQNFI